MNQGSKEQKYFHQCYQCDRLWPAGSLSWASEEVLEGRTWAKCEEDQNICKEEVCAELLLCKFGQVCKLKVIL